MKIFRITNKTHSLEHISTSLPFVLLKTNSVERKEEFLTILKCVFSVIKIQVVLRLIPFGFNTLKGNKDSDEETGNKI